MLSGWVTANSVPDNITSADDAAQDTVKQCGLRAVLTYTDNTVEYQYVSFNTDLKDRQFVSYTIVPKEENQSKTLSTIQVICAYEKNANIAYFDDISLVREAAQTMKYDDEGNLVSVTTSGLNEDTNEYDASNNLIKTVTGGNGTYEYTYDTKHRLTGIEVMNLATTDESDALLTQAMVYDTYGNVTSTTLTGTSTRTLQSSATYTNSGNLLNTATDSAGNTTTYAYSANANKLFGIPSTITDAKGTATSQTIDAFGRYSQITVASTNKIGYNNSGSLLSKITRTAGNLTQAYDFTYDTFGNMKSVKAGTYTRSYTYKDLSSTQTTTQVSKVSYSGLTSNPSYGYTYDALGYIATYTAPDGEVITYTYDSMGQLLKAAGDTTYTYTYDGFGNILTANGHTYTYGNTGWRDLLTAFDGQTISYDASGNPTSYYNGIRWTLGWREGNRLISASGNNSIITYSYDHNGVRTKKTTGGVAHNYYYAGGKLLRETYGSNTLDFFYDANGTPLALKYNGVRYLYITNLQGDVMHLIDNSGNVVASYEYDPYGNIVSSSGTMAEINPLRYRGYYYDSETGFYYCQSRYYDPAIGRFINADSYVSTGEGILGHNMFAYCLNNPVNGCDPCGSCFHRWDFWNDCEECGGKTIEDKWNDYVSCVYECYTMQIEAEQQVAEMQLQLVNDATATVLEALLESVEMQYKAHQQEVQAFYAVFIDPLDATEKNRLRGTVVTTVLTFGISMAFGLPGVVAGSSALGAVTATAGVDALKAGIGYYLFRVMFEDIEE